MAATNMFECSLLVEVETHSKCEKTERQLKDRREFLHKTHPDVGKYDSLSISTITCQREGNSYSDVYICGHFVEELNSIFIISVLTMLLRFTVKYFS